MLVSESRCLCVRKREREREREMKDVRDGDSVCES